MSIGNSSMCFLRSVDSSLCAHSLLRLWISKDKSKNINKHTSERWSNYQNYTPLHHRPTPNGTIWSENQTLSNWRPKWSRHPNPKLLLNASTTDHIATARLHRQHTYLPIKSVHTHLELMNDRLSTLYELILIQEPHTNTFNNIRTPTNFRAVYPSHRLQSNDPIRSVIWVNNSIDTSNWIALDIPNTNDITAIQLTNNTGTISIFNIYNDCLHSHNKHSLNSYINNNRHKILATENHHLIWAGDFNRHHPLWDDDNDIHLFTQQAITRAT